MTHARPHNLGRPGFSFPEVLFAVIILGVGLIMVASMFPIGIRLSQQASDNASADAIGRAAVEMIRATCDADMIAVTTTPFVRTVTTGVDPFDKIDGQRINSTDPRYGFVPFYKWAGGSGTSKKIIVVVTRSRRDDTYPATELAIGLIPKTLTGVRFFNGGGTTDDTLQIATTASVNTDAKYVGEGAFIIVADYATSAAANGNVYRVGELLDTTGVAPNLTYTYRLLAGRDLQQANYSVKPVNAAGAKVFVVGKQLSDPTDATSATVGSAQDVSVIETSYPAP